MAAPIFDQRFSALNNAEQFKDSIYQDLLGQTLDDFSMKLLHLAMGIFEFRAEAWRRSWQQLLSQKDVTFYYSTALVKSPKYRQDKPGSSPMAFNKSVASQLETKRIFMIWEEVWDNVDIKRWIQGRLRLYLGNLGL